MSREEHPLVTRYREFSPTSEKLSARTQRVFPGGDTRSSAHYGPYPLVIEQATGCRLTDVDGNELIDFMNNFTSLIHGHAHPDVVRAVQEQVAQGTAYGAPSKNQIELAELLADRVPSIEQLRFTSSGTEGTQMGIRCARAATGRQKIMKMEGGYHGSYELAEVSLVPIPQQCGPHEAPASVGIDASFPDSVLADTVVCPYNEPEFAKRLIAEHASELAGVIVEPVLGSMGMVPATTGFLRALRESTCEHGIVLIFDEVITLRLGTGGAQAGHGVTPDLSCMGKIIGGGLPIGALGGRRELLQLFSPEQHRPVMHASTFSGNALSMAAGAAAMQAYQKSDVERMHLLGEQLREGFNRAFREAGIRAQALGQGSLSNIHFTDSAVTNAREAFSGMRAGGEFAGLLHLGMLRHGVMAASRGMYAISSVMRTEHIERTIAALEASLRELGPYLEAERPGLLAGH